MSGWIALACACGKPGGDGGGGSSDGDSTVASEATAPMDGSESDGSMSVTTTAQTSDDTSAGSSGIADTGVTSVDSGGSDSGESDSGGTTTGPDADCEAPQLQSSCGNPNSIIRGIATLPEGAIGDALVVSLAHQYLGSGASGGIPHTGTVIAGVDADSGAIAFELDMCTGGEMWSEENCEFQIAVTLDGNGNGLVDPGEPTGTTFVFVSCTGDNPCLDLALDCVDGSACLGFDDPAYCGCPGNGQSCSSPIVAC